MRAVVEPLVPNTKEPAERRLPPNVTFPVSVEVPATVSPVEVSLMPSTLPFAENERPPSDFIEES